MRQVPALIRALAALFALAACDKLPGFPQRNAAAVKGPSALAMGPWLLDPGASAMTVAWVTDAPSLGRVWYGTTATDRLATAAEPGENVPFHVLVYGDNRSNSGDHALVVRAAAAEHTQLALHTGDMVVDARDQDGWRVWFREEHDLLANTPFIATVGN